MSIALIALTALGGARALADEPASSASSVDRSVVERTIASWPPRSLLAARQMLDKYGAPNEATAAELVWRDHGGFKRIVVSKVELPHNFPKPHVDVITHTVAYRVPAAKAGALAAFDGSISFDRTAGELSVRGDTEDHNFLALNLAHDIITRNLSPTAARAAFAKTIAEASAGARPRYVMALQFNTAAKAKTAADAGAATIAGSPKRAPAGLVDNSQPMSDAEILGTLIAIHEGEIRVASQAERESLSPKVLQFAMTMHKDHGKLLASTMKVAKTAKITPLETTAVENLRLQNARDLAALVPLEGPRFSSAFLAAMVKQHNEVLDQIDEQLATSAKHAAVKKLLAETRLRVAMHAEMAEQLQNAGSEPQAMR
ncbi:MAG: DUF4142 domain-containing protein [Kofleriaceae bacterium]